MNTVIRRPQATPVRWQAAAERAGAEGVTVRQPAGCGAWIATSGTDAGAAYELEVVGEIVHGCTCLAGLHGDPVCKHRAAFYLMIGVLDLPAPVTVQCPECQGCGLIYSRECESVGFPYPACQPCQGTGQVAVTLVAA